MVPVGLGDCDARAQPFGLRVAGLAPTDKMLLQSIDISLRKVSLRKGDEMQAASLFHGFSYDD
jgi:hypothetical protein